MDRKNSNLHKQSASLGEHQLHHVLQKSGQVSNNLIKNSQYLNSDQQHLQSQTDDLLNNNIFQNSQLASGHDSQINSTSIVQNQKSQRINQQQQISNSNIVSSNPSSSSNNQQQINLLKGNGPTSTYQGITAIGTQSNIISDYRNISKNLNSRQSIGNSSAVNGITGKSSVNTPIGALTASFSQQINGPQEQFSTSQNQSVTANQNIGKSVKNNSVQQSQIIQNKIMRQSIGPSSNISHLKYNKENVEMRSTSSGAPNSISVQNNRVERQHYLQQHQAQGGVAGHQPQFYGQQKIIKYLGGNSNNKHSQKNFSSSQATQNGTKQVNAQSIQTQQYAQPAQTNQQQFSSSHHSSITANNQFNKTTSFLKGAATGLTVNQLHQQISNNNQSIQSTTISQINQQQQQQIFQQQYSSNQLLQQSNNSINAEFGKDITNFTNSKQNILLGHGQQNQNINGQIHQNNTGFLTSGATSQSQYSQQSMKQSHNSTNIQTTFSNRIPQPSIINSATGNMNQLIGRNTINGGSSVFQIQGSQKNLEPFSLGNHITGNSTNNSSTLINTGIGNSNQLNNIESSYHSQQQVLNKINVDEHSSKQQQIDTSNLINQSSSGTSCLSTSNQAYIQNQQSKFQINKSSQQIQANILNSQGISSNPNSINRTVVGQESSLSKMLQKPMIIDKYSNVGQSNNLNSVQLAMQQQNQIYNGANKNASQILSASRQLSRETPSNNNALNSSLISSININGIGNGGTKQFESINSSAAAQALRKSTHQNNLSQVSQNQQKLNQTTNHQYMKRMHSSGNPNNHSVLASCPSTTNQSSTSATATQRFQNHQTNQANQGKSNSGEKDVQAPSTNVQRNIRIDQRLANTLSNATNNINQTVSYENGKIINGNTLSTQSQMPQNSSFIGVNKYHQHHLYAHQYNKNTGVIQNFKETKSGQNLNGNLQNSVIQNKQQISSIQNLNQNQQNAPQTQRGNRNQSNGSSQGLTGTNGIVKNVKSTIKNSINRQNATTVNQNPKQSSNGKGNSQQFEKQPVSGVTQKILKEQQDKLQDKENKQSLTNKPQILQGKTGNTTLQNSSDFSSNNIVKRTRTFNGDSRQSIVPNNQQKKQVNQQAQNQIQGGTITQQQQSNKKGLTTGSSQFKNSDQCEKSSSQGINTSSKMQSSSHNHTNRSNGTAKGQSLQRLNSQANQLLNNGQSFIDTSKPSNTINQNFNDPQIQQQPLQNSKSQNIQKKSENIGSVQNLKNQNTITSNKVKIDSNLNIQSLNESDKVDDQQPLIKLQEVQCISNQVNIEMVSQFDKQYEVEIQREEQVNTQIVIQCNDQLKARTEVYVFNEQILDSVVKEMEDRRKKWLKSYKTQLDLNDVLEIRNPQSVIEFVPEIMVNLKKEELKHVYPSNFLNANVQREISEKYRQYLVDWLAELHYKFKMWPETLFVTVGIIDKTLMKWPNFRKNELQSLGITALHIAGKYEEIYPPELKTILQVIDNAVNRQQVCTLESEILSKLDFDMVWPSVLRFMQRYACISNFSQEQHMIAQMFCDFILLSTNLLQHRPSLLGAVAIYATNKITNRSRPWNQSLVKCTQGIKEEDVKNLANELFYFVKKLEQSSLKTMFRKYELPNYLNVVQVLQRIQMPAQVNKNEVCSIGVNQQESLQNSNNSVQQDQFKIRYGTDSNVEQVLINE